MYTYVCIYINIYIYVCVFTRVCIMWHGSAAIGDWDAGSDGVGSSVGVGRKPSSPTVGHFFIIPYIYIYT